MIRVMCAARVILSKAKDPGLKRTVVGPIATPGTANRVILSNAKDPDVKRIDR